jgi:Cys-tRNA(Pro) deacylase
MKKQAVPATQGVRFLRDNGVEFTPHFYDYEEHGGTARAADELEVEEHSVVKTLVMETDERKPLIVLMHGDCEVSTKELARQMGVRRVEPCDAAAAHRHTGYQVGGISPFGTKGELPVFCESTVLSLPRVYLNGGKRGFLVEISPVDLERVLPVLPVRVAIRSDD